jgi:hypothetical protein
MDPWWIRPPLNTAFGRETTITLEKKLFSLSPT